MERLTALSVRNYLREPVQFRLIRQPNMVLLIGIVPKATPAWQPRWRRLIGRRIPMNPGYFFWGDLYHGIWADDRDELRVEPSDGLVIEWGWA